MQTILLTGANGGIGSTIKKIFEQNGDIVIAVTSADADLSKFENVQQLAEKILTQTPKIDWLICAHGYIDTKTVLEEQTAQDIEATFAVNSLSLFWLAKEFLSLIPAGGGMVVISSSTGLSPNGRYAAYSASKAAANAFVQAMARNRPEKKFFAVAPGPTNTTMRERVAHDAALMQSPVVIAEEIKKIVADEGDYKSGDVILIKDSAASIASRLV